MSRTRDACAWGSPVSEWDKIDTENGSMKNYARCKNLVVFATHILASRGDEWVELGMFVCVQVTH